MRLFLLFFSIGILSSDSFTELKELYASDGPFSAGKKLVKLKPGIHYLEPINSRIKIDYTEKYNLSKFQKSFI